MTMMTPGEYNLYASLQHHAMQPSIPFLAQAAESVPIVPGRPVAVADLGASHGINSIQPVKAVLAALAARTPSGETLEVALYHADLPSNDFSELISLIQDPQRSYLPQQQRHGASNLAVFPYLIARSFYERLFTSASVHITFAFTTLHFLSCRPARNGVSLFANGNPDPAFRAAWTAQALQDLTSFLTLRATETVPGGALVAHFPVLETDDPEQWGMGTHLLEQAGRIGVVQENLQDGSLLVEELANMASYAFCISPKQVRGVLHDVQHLWTVQESFVRPVEEPLPARLAAGELTAKDVAEAACKRMSAVCRAWMVGQLALTRGTEAAQAEVDAMFEEFRGKMVAAPCELGAMPFMYLKLERRLAAAG